VQAMRFNLVLAVLLLACPPLQAKQDNTLPMELMELLGEWDDEDQAALDDALADVQPKPTKKQPPASSTGDQQ
jgi:hypothetical protein